MFTNLEAQHPTQQNTSALQTRRAFLPRIAAITGGITAALFGAPATAAGAETQATLPPTPAAPSTALPLVPIGYGLEPQYRDALAVALEKIGPVLRQSGAVPCSDCETSSPYFDAIYAVAGPLGIAAAREAADTKDRELAETIRRGIDGAPQDTSATTGAVGQAMSDPAYAVRVTLDHVVMGRCWEYQLFAEGAYLFGIAAGLHLAAAQKGGAL